MAQSHWRNCLLEMRNKSETEKHVEHLIPQELHVHCDAKRHSEGALRGSRATADAYRRLPIVSTVLTALKSTLVTQTVKPAFRHNSLHVYRGRCESRVVMTVPSDGLLRSPYS
ncbi:hypothetical protein EYF80_032264 [Liparis tanakae]|uniref:Uncharacterized protein n=1 Tax=Liparis tanakae TaxID=230148 RepID=A0A4Z2GWC2_9TELE|nr:hypothetical protein EYF80_032264 [Liparis tanakae]